MKNLVILVISLIFVVNMASCSSFEQSKATDNNNDLDKDKLTLLLSLDKDTYTLDEQILVRLMIRNENGPLLVNKRMAMNSLFAHKKYRDVTFTIRNSLGEEFPLKTFFDIRPLDADDFVLLYGLQAIEASFPDIGYWFGLNIPGEYTIQGRYENNSDPKDGREAWKGVLFSNIVHFTINP